MASITTSAAEHHQHHTDYGPLSTSAQDYERGKIIGQGANGCVQQVTYLPTGKQYVMKTIEARHPKNGFKNSVVKEILLMKRVNHPNVLRSRAIFHTSSPVPLIDLSMPPQQQQQHEHKQQHNNSTSEAKGGNNMFQYANIISDFADMDLAHYIALEAKRPRGLRSEHLDIAFQLLRGLDYLHQERVMHRDLKPGNVLLFREADKTWNVRLADFGLCRKCHRVGTGDRWSDYALETATAGFKAPELELRTNDYDQQVDMWCVGIILLELLSRVNLHRSCQHNVRTKSEISNLIFYLDHLGGIRRSTWKTLSKRRSVRPDIRKKLKALRKNKEAQRHFALLGDDVDIVAIRRNALLKLSHCTAEQVSPLYLDLMARCFAFLPGERITAADALQHPVFKVQRGSFPKVLHSPMPMFGQQKLLHNRRKDLMSVAQRKHFLHVIKDVLTELRFSESSIIGTLYLFDNVYDKAPQAVRAKIQASDLLRQAYALTICQIAQKVYRDRPYHLNVIVSTFLKRVTGVHLPDDSPFISKTSAMIEELECQTIMYMEKFDVNFYSETIYTQCYECATYAEMLELVYSKPAWLAQGDFKYFPTFYRVNIPDFPQVDLKKTIATNGSIKYFQRKLAGTGDNKHTKYVPIRVIDFNGFLNHPEGVTTQGDLK